MMMFMAHYRREMAIYSWTSPGPVATPVSIWMLRKRIAQHTCNPFVVHQCILHSSHQVLSLASGNTQVEDADRKSLPGFVDF